MARRPALQSTPGAGGVLEAQQASIHTSTSTLPQSTQVGTAVSHSSQVRSLRKGQVGEWLPATQEAELLSVTTTLSF